MGGPKGRLLSGRPGRAQSKESEGDDQRERRSRGEKRKERAMGHLYWAAVAGPMLTGQFFFYYFDYD